MVRHGYSTARHKKRHKNATRNATKKPRGDVVELQQKSQHASRNLGQRLVNVSLDQYLNQRQPGSAPKSTSISKNI